MPRCTATALVSVAVVLVGLACERRARGPLVDASLIKEAAQGYPNYYERWAEVYDTRGLARIPIASFSGQQLPVIDIGQFLATYEDEAQFPADSLYDFEVTHYRGQARAEIYLPADFRITRPDSDYRLTQGSGLNIVWQRARGAGWYVLGMLLEYQYADSNQQPRSFRLWLDTTIYDTVCTLAAERLFPARVGQVLEGGAVAAVMAGDGPEIVQGDRGNVMGEGFGYAVGTNQCEEVYFTVEQAPAAFLDRREPGRRLRVSLRQRLRQLSGISDASDSNCPKRRP